MIYTIGVFESRIGGSSFLILPGLWVEGPKPWIPLRDLVEDFQKSPEGQLRLESHGLVALKLGVLLVGVRIIRAPAFRVENFGKFHFSLPEHHRDELHFLSKGCFGGNERSSFKSPFSLISFIWPGIWGRITTRMSHRTL